MLELKTISSQGVPRAVAKAERYRLLNEPQEAESICRDILAVDADNQEVLAMLLLSITDQFGRNADVGPSHALRALARLRGDYERAYYAGVISERWGKASLHGAGHHGLSAGFFHEAMASYQKAISLAPAGNDDAVLRWNACVRFIEQDADLGADSEEALTESGFPDGAPARVF